MLDLMKSFKTVLIIVVFALSTQVLAKGSFGGGRSGGSSFSGGRSSSSFGGNRSYSPSPPSRPTGGSSFGGNRSGASTGSKSSAPPVAGRASTFGGNRATSGPVTVTRPQPPEYNRGYSWGRTYYPGYGYSYYRPYGSGFTMWHYLLFWELMRPQQQMQPLVVNEQGMVMQNPGYGQQQSGGGFFHFLFGIIFWSVLLGVLGYCIYAISKHISWR